ncbi:hypothetical protein LINPERPRIM_LOCUS6176 [Linum perenne]
MTCQRNWWRGSGFPIFLSISTMDNFLLLLATSSEGWLKLI